MKNQQEIEEAWRQRVAEDKAREAEHKATEAEHKIVTQRRQNLKQKKQKELSEAASDVMRELLPKESKTTEAGAKEGAG